jgi:hypothetical protein
MLPVRHCSGLTLDVQRRPTVGGGAARKARGLIQCGCRSIVVIAPPIRAEMPRTLQRIESPYQSRDLP